MKILITGGTGFIGRALTKSLLNQAHEVSVLSRNPASVEKLFGHRVHSVNHFRQIDAETAFDVIINLAGAPIFGARWTQQRKKIIRDSRIGLTEALLSAIDRMTVKPKLLISGSAIGYYGDQGDGILTERSSPRVDFSHTLCADWEAAALKAEEFGTRVCLMRTGLVIGPNGGLLQRMLLPFRLGLGGRIGSGKQWMSWIHLHDWIKIAERMISDSSMQGVYNATAPNPVTNAEFTEILANGLHRPALLPVPGGLLKILLGEMSELLLASQRVLPERLLTRGFEFEYSDFAEAIDQVLVD